jgi:hypothetical protein
VACRVLTHESFASGCCYPTKAQDRHQEQTSNQVRKKSRFCEASLAQLWPLRSTASEPAPEGQLCGLANLVIRNGGRATVSHGKLYTKSAGGQRTSSPTGPPLGAVPAERWMTTQMKSLATWTLRGFYIAKRQLWKHLLESFRIR